MPYKNPKDRKEYERKRKTRRQVRLAQEALDRTTQTRICGADECAVVLSRYNAGDLCALHEKAKIMESREVSSFI